jgi:hypothetical protein
VEFIELLEAIDRTTPAEITLIHVICDNVSIHGGKRFRAPNFADLVDLETKVMAFITEWNETAHPFKWTTASFEKILLRAEGWRPRERHGRRPQGCRVAFTTKGLATGD